MTDEPKIEWKGVRVAVGKRRRLQDFGYIVPAPSKASTLRRSIQKHIGSHQEIGELYDRMTAISPETVIAKKEPELPPYWHSRFIDVM